jgi:hypothetical protein
MQEEMIIQVRVFDMLNWLVPKVERFPRLYRHTVCSRLIGHALDLHEVLVQARYKTGPGRVRDLQAGDMALKQLVQYLRMAHHWQWLNDGQYQHISQMVVEIGKLLGAWLKHSKASVEK